MLNRSAANEKITKQTTISAKTLLPLLYLLFNEILLDYNKLPFILFLFYPQSQASVLR